MHLSGGDYQLLEPYRKKKKIPLMITSKVFIKGSTYEIEMHVQNVAKKADFRSLTYMNNFTAKQGNGDFDMASLEPATSGTAEKHEVGLFQRIFRCFTKKNGSLKVTEVNGANVGVAFFLHFSVHALKTDHKEGETTISRWCLERLCPLRSLLRSLRVSRLELRFMAGITMVGILSIELGKEYSFNFVCNLVEV